MSIGDSIRTLPTRIINAVKGFRLGHSLLILPHEQTRGKWQPQDYTKQVEAVQDIVYACIRLMAVTAAKVKLRLYQKKKSGNDEELPDHRFLDLMREVNPYMNAFELKYLTVMYMKATGNAYWLLNPDRLGIPAEIWVEESQNMIIVPDAQRHIKSYIYKYRNQEIRYDPEQIIHFKYPNPNDPWYGASPTWAAAYAIDANEYLNRYHTGIFKRGGVPGSIINVEGKLDADGKKRLETSFKQKYGSFEKSGGVAVIAGSKSSIQKVSMTPQELDYIGSQNIIMDRVCGIMNVPSLLLSKTEKVNRSNMEAAYIQFLRDNTMADLIMMDEKLNEKLIPRYQGQGLYCKHDNPIPTDKKQELMERESRLDKWITTINEERDRMGLDPVDWGDVPLVPMNVVPLGSAPAMPLQQPKIIKTNNSLFKQYTEQEKYNKWRQFVAKITPQERSFERDLQRYFRRQLRIILSNLEQMKAYMRKDALDYIMFALDSENEQLVMLSNPHWKDAMTSAALDKIAGLGLQIDWDMRNPRIIAWLERKTMEIKSINDVTISRIRAILTEGIEEGLGVPEMVKNIREEYVGFEKYRALRIARTEIVGASNFGGHEVLEEADIEKHAWLTARDELVRESHRDAEAEGWIPLHQSFGNDCPYPGVGPASEVVNCRCTELP